MLFHLEDVRYRYPDQESTSMGPLSLDISEREFLLVTGRSGAGKESVPRW